LFANCLQISKNAAFVDNNNAIFLRKGIADNDKNEIYLLSYDFKTD